MKQRFFDFLKKNKVYNYVMSFIGSYTYIEWEIINPENYVFSIVKLIESRGYLTGVIRIFLLGLNKEWQDELNKPQYTIDTLPNQIEIEGIKYNLIITKNKDKYSACYMKFVPNAQCIISENPFHRRVEDALQDMCDLLNQ